MKFEDAPRLPKLPFIVGDVALLLLAGFIAVRHPDPLSPLPLLIITGCVGAGCLVFIIPIVINYVRDQEEIAGALRRELSEQFKRLMAASEHLQHSTVQLKTIEEIATKNLQAAERLPYRLQEKIAEFNQQLAETESEDKEALEQELATLRSTENDRLTTAADKIAKAVAEWTRLEAGTRQQLAAAGEFHEKLFAVLAAIDGKIAALEAAAKTAPPAITLVPAVPASEPPVVAKIESIERPAVTPLPVLPGSSPSFEAALAGTASDEPAIVPSVVAKDDSSPDAPPKSPRAPRKHKTAAPFVPEPSSPAAAAELAGRSTEISAPPSSLPATPESVPPAVEAPPPANPAPATAPLRATPAPAPSPESVSAVAPVVVGSAEPPAPASAPDDSASSPAAKPPRKPRAPRPPKPGEPAPGAGSSPALAPPSPTAQPAELIAEPVTDEPPAPESFSQVPPEENLPLATPSADGRTRLTVTSYIGIGNKLYLRGEGPGLSVTKGVPLQFVSIGRWRWETGEATAPVVCRIYKNDKLEAPLGPLTLAPGTEQEVSATF